MDTSYNNQIHQCVWCDNEAKICCKSCDKVWYCSREHQRLHWQDHYEDCPSYKIKSSPEAGQYLVASRNMKPGNLILKDDPIVTGPLGTSGLICLACHKPIYTENFSTCPDCSWPVCSIDCASEKVHDDECDILSRDKKLIGVPHTQGETPRYDLIFILRCLLLRETNPPMWRLLLSMASHGRVLKEAKEPHQVAAVRYFTDICKVDYDIDTIHHVRGVILANALEIRGPNGSLLRALYPNIRLLNHSCLPNVHLACDSEGTMEVRAAVSLKRGDNICIAYTGTDVPLWERRECLLNNHYFHCTCQRCSDSSELNTNFSSARCPVCPQQLMNPTPNGDSIVWKCPKCKTQSSVEEIKQEIEDWLFRLEMNDLFGSGTPFQISHALSMIDQHFHIKHFIWLKAGQAALYKMAYNTSFSALKLKKYIWEKILDIYNVLEPGLTRRRGMALFELAMANLYLANRDFEAEGELSRHQIESFLREAEGLLSESFRILRHEPAGTPEAKMAQTIPYKISFILKELGELD